MLVFDKRNTFSSITGRRWRGNQDGSYQRLPFLTEMMRYERFASMLLRQDLGCGIHAGMGEDRNAGMG